MGRRSCMARCMPLHPATARPWSGPTWSGSRDTPRHALLLGLTVTTTHTLGVYALGLVTLFAAALYCPNAYIRFGRGLRGSGIVTPLRDRVRLATPTGGYQRRRGWASRRPEPGRSGAAFARRPDSQPRAPAGGRPGRFHPQPAHPGYFGRVGALSIGAAGDARRGALNRVAFGLVLIAAFSLGLAVVLMGTGLALVYAGRLFDRLPINARSIQ